MYRHSRSPSPVPASRHPRRRQVGEQPRCFGRRHLVLDRDVRPVALAVLRGERPRPLPGQPVAERHQLGGVHHHGHAPTQRPQPRQRHRQRRASDTHGRQVGGDVGLVFPRQGVEQRDVSREEVAVRREVRLPQGVQPGEQPGVEVEGEDERGGHDGRAGGHDQHPLPLGELHGRVERADHPVLHNAVHGHRPGAGEEVLHRPQRGAGGDDGGRQVRLGGDGLVQRLPARRYGCRVRWSAWQSQ